MPGRDVITAEDREYLGPVLGCPEMVALLLSDRARWQQAGALIVRGFLAGKEAQRARPQS